MTLSPEVSGKIIFPDSLSAQITPLSDIEQILSESAIYEAINPRILSVEAFWNLDGIMQETVLVSLLKSGDKNKINELRPDFEINRPLVYNEIRMSQWTEKITQRNTPIIAPLEDIDDGLFSQIHHTVYSIQKSDLAEILERERKRRNEFKPGMFSPSESIEKFSAAIRYRGILENHIKEEIKQEMKRAA